MFQTQKDFIEAAHEAVHITEACDMLRAVPVNTNDPVITKMLRRMYIVLRTVVGLDEKQTHYTLHKWVSENRDTLERMTVTEINANMLFNESLKVFYKIHYDLTEAGLI